MLGVILVPCRVRSRRSTSISGALVRQFCERELAPTHVAEWERDELFPNWVFKRAGELGSSARTTRGRRGCGRRLLVQRRQERGAAAMPDGGRVDGPARPVRHGDAGHQRSRHRGAEGRVSHARHPRREDRRARRERAQRRERRRGDRDRRQDATATTTSSTGSKTFITNGTRADFVTLLAKTTPEAGAHGCSFFLVPTETKRLPRCEEAQEDRQSLERHRRAALRRDARAEAIPARRREHGVHVPHAELPERTHHRLHERGLRAAT